MYLKHRDDVQWRDLPKVESPFFARAWVETNLHLSGYAPPMIHGLEDVIRDDLTPYAQDWEEYVRDRLLDRVGRAEVLLVHGDASRPLDPAVRRVDGGEGLGWSIQASVSLEARHNIERMLANAYQHRGIWQPIILPDEPAPAPAPKPREEPEELTVTNPRWEHIDQKRADNSPDSTIAGDRITLMVDVTGAPDGSRVTFKVFDTSISPPARVGSARGEVEGGVGKAEWEVKIDRSSPALEFEGAVRRVSSDRAEIPVGIREYILSI